MLEEMVVSRPPGGGSRPVPIGPVPSEQSHLGGLLPAEPARLISHDKSNSILIQRGNQMLSTFTAAMQFRPRSSRPPPTGVSSLLCAPGAISILRRHLM